MARTIEPQEPALTDLVRGIAQLAGGAFVLGGTSQLAIGETFEQWWIGVVQSDETRELHRIARPSHHYHHQLILQEAGAASRAIGIARSHLVGGGKLQVDHVAETWLADKVDRAISVVDELPEVSSDALARLLSAPAYAVHAFWFVNSDHELVYPFAGPQTLKFLSIGTLMSAAVFVAALKDESPIRGVRFDA